VKVIGLVDGSMRRLGFTSAVGDIAVWQLLESRDHLKSNRLDRVIRSGWLLFFLIVLGCLALVLVRGAAAAEARTALVIGNSAYPFARLANPANDASDMAIALRGGLRCIAPNRCGPARHARVD
jgi:hypothetical protein